MALPSYVVEIQFGSSSYIDVTQYVQSVSISRGITRSLDDFPAGSVSVTFVNNNRVFDPLNTSSPLWYSAGGYTMIQPGGRLRVSSNSIRIFTGFVQSWEFTFDESGLDGKATVMALDEIFKINNLTFDASTEGIVQDTGSRIQQVLNYAGFGASEYSGVTVGKTIVGADVHAAGDNVLAYLQNVARSEPADFYSNASAVMQLKDRNFANLSWTNTIRNNLIAYPGTASQDTTRATDDVPLGNGWYTTYRPTTKTPKYAGKAAIADPSNADGLGNNVYEFFYRDTNQAKYNPNNLTTIAFTYSAWVQGNALLSANGGVSATFTLKDSTGNQLGTASVGTVTAASTATWNQLTGTVSYSGTGIPVGITLYLGSNGSTSPYSFFGSNFQVEQGTSLPIYFDGTYNPYTSTASTVYNVGWSGLQYNSYSGLVTSVSTSTSAPTINFFADENSQSSIGGTGIPFTDITVAYAGDRLYNSVQVVGVNAVSSASDTALISRYGLREYSQQDNLTTSLTRTAEIASKYLDAFKMPEYRADQLTVAVHGLTTAQQNRVLAIELRDVVRVLFKPSNTGAVVDKYYEVIGVDSQIDTDRHEISFRVSSLDYLGSIF
jgi:hypothetical protein